MTSAFPKSERAPRKSAIAEQVRDADACLPLIASVRISRVDSAKRKCTGGRRRASLDVHLVAHMKVGVDGRG